MRLSPEMRLLVLIIIAFLIGILVLLLNPDYNVENNLQSNADYYPDSFATPGDPGSADEADTDADMKKDFEF